MVKFSIHLKSFSEQNSLSEDDGSCGFVELSVIFYGLISIGSVGFVTFV